MTGKSCLLLVDIQNDFLPGGALAVGDGDKILPTVYSLVESGEFDLIVASKMGKWWADHPEGHVSFASTHGGEVFTPKEVPKLREQGTVTQMLWPDHCVQGTRGSELEAGLQTRLDRLGGDKVKTVYKGRHALVDSYSAFADNQYTAFTALSRILHENGITDVHIVGLATDYCVRATAIDSCKFGFRTTVHAAGVRGVDGGREGEVLEELAGWGCMVV